MMSSGPCTSSTVTSRTRRRGAGCPMPSLMKHRSVTLLTIKMRRRQNMKKLKKILYTQTRFSLYSFLSVLSFHGFVLGLWSQENLGWGWLPLWSGELLKPCLELSKKQHKPGKIYIFWIAWTIISNFLKRFKLVKPCLLSLKDLAVWPIFPFPPLHKS
jgi:hypothetical protein